METSVLPLQGIRVLDWTMHQAGPCATMLLGDLGAEVLKVETTSGGESGRGQANVAGRDMGLANGLSYTFEVYNRNKKSLALDLSKPEGREIMYSLAKVCDIFAQNHRTGVAEKLGMGYETLKEHNPKIIYASCTGYGRKGPRAHSPAMDPAVHAASGMMFGVGEPDMGPIHIIGAMADMTTAMMLANAMMSALVCRERTGIGQEVHVSMLGTRLWIQSNNILYTLQSGKSRPRQFQSKAPNPLVNHYRCKDGKWLLMGNFQSDKYWPRLCSVMGLQGIEYDPRFADIGARRENCEELITILNDTFATRDRDEWVTRLEEESVVVSPILEYSEVVNDPQVLANDLLPEFDHPALGKIRETGIPIEFSETPGSIREPAPQLGQHTEEVLVDLLGYSWGDIERLHDNGVIL